MQPECLETGGLIKSCKLIRNFQKIVILNRIAFVTRFSFVISPIRVYCDNLDPIQTRFLPDLAF